MYMNELSDRIEFGSRPPELHHSSISLETTPEFILVVVMFLIQEKRIICLFILVVYKKKPGHRDRAF